MKAEQFARFTTGNRFQFGVIPQKELVSKLRELADRIERDASPRLCLSEAYSCDQATIEDFLVTTLVLSFTELKPDAEKGAKLYGGENFPLEVAK